MTDPTTAATSSPTSASPPTVAHAVVAALRAAGVRRVHGVPGEDHLRLLHAIDEGGLEYIAARDESAAGVMATAEAQFTGVPGVLLVTPAPGITNAINGIASAALDHVPLIVIVGQHAPERRPVIVRQNLDNHALLAPLVKWSATLGPRVHQVMAKVLDTALLGDPGPVLVELRDDVAKLAPLDTASEWPIHAPASAIVARAGVAAPLREALASARRPVVLVGGRGRSAEVGAGVSAFVEAARAPVFTTPSAKGAVAHDSRWLAGTFLNGNLEDAIIGRADLIVGVGLDAGDIFNGAWRHSIPFIALEPDPLRVQHFFPTSTLILGELSCLLDEARPAGSPSEWAPAEVTAYRESISERFIDPDPNGTLTIPAGIADARSVLPDDTLVTVDAGFGKPLMSMLWDARIANAYVSSQGLSTMGYAIPAANALKLVAPGRTVVGFLGDGSLLMRASEISVAAAHGIAPIYIVWVDGSLSQIEVKQLRQDLRNVGVQFAPPSCAAIAAAFGGTGHDVTTRAEFREVLRAALGASGPVLIGVRVDQARRGEWFESLRG